LIFQAIKASKCKMGENVGEKRVYFQSIAITAALGSIDELYQGVLSMRSFIWYDIFLNTLGGVLGLTLFWGLKRESEVLRS